MHVLPSTTILELKELISKALTDEITKNNIRVFIPETKSPLPDEATISDHNQITNDSILHLAFRKSGFDESDDSEESWEEIQVSSSGFPE